MSILVTGGAGYIGSHTVRYLKEKNEDVIVLDNLQTGYKESVDVEKFYKLDLRDKEIDRVFKENEITGVIHFAANSLVGVSVREPYEYYDNNVYGTLCLLKAMMENNVKNIVFSSTAAVYGEPKNIPILESDLTIPTNPYGETKLTMEKMMKWFDNAYGTKYVSLRYFNAAGAHEKGDIGECHNPETHLIPLILQVPLGEREKVSIFGDDYDTPDGTCIRDYIHVWDLADAHYLAYKYMLDGNHSEIFNLGSGNGFSVKEVVDVARRVTGHEIPAEIADRRPGDPAVLVASSDKIKKTLGWNPQRTNLEEIIQDAWRFHKNHPRGYNK
ncbi:MAG: UDP-glucose 4-epimerase GalE [Tissierellia bacterium]|jgi:UDP-glucose 4-epimerase|nr:UDP-glucose 4-epimerase GalE [Tissierellia bacterium]